MDIAVVGSGGWGTALSMLLHENRHEVTLISYSKEESDNLAKTLENPFLPGVKLPEDMRYTADPAAVAGCTMVVVVPPSFAIRSTAERIAPHLRPDAIPLIFFSLSPTHILFTCEIFTCMMSRPVFLAIWSALSVFPVPGSP